MWKRGIREFTVRGKEMGGKKSDMKRVREREREGGREREREREREKGRGRGVIESTEGER